VSAAGVLRVVEGSGYRFWCPGCQSSHGVRVGQASGANWGFNGDLERPTFTPSVLVRSGHFIEGHQGECWCSYEARHGEPPGFSCGVCHSFVTAGQIQFLGDCTHALAGQTVPLPEFPE
jgi:hypothetical protein